MPYESEAKFKVDSFESALAAIRKARGRFLGAVLQTDVYYDTADGSLRRGDSAVRLRRVRSLTPARVAQDIRPLLTYKGPRRGRAKIKIRKEVQTRVETPEAIDAILAAGNLRPAMTIQKRRASYQLGRCRVELDELPRLGRFIEVEGPTTRAVLALWKKLNTPGEMTTESYTRLAVCYCKARGISARTFMFSRSR